MSEKGLKIFLLAAIIFGIAIRIAVLPFYEPEHGAVLQLAMAKSFQEKGEFNMEYGPIFDPNNFEPSPSHHFPPLYPWLIAHTMNLSNINLNCFKIFSFILSIITIFLLYYLTRLVFTPTAGLALAALWSTNAIFIDDASKCLSENLQVILITGFLTLFILSKKKPWLLIPSGLVLGLAYLSKSTLPFWGTIFAIIVGAILLIVSARKNVIFIMSGLFLFFLTILSWGLRNYRLFGSFETSEYISSSVNRVFSGFSIFFFIIYILVFIVIPILLYLLISLGYFYPELAKIDESKPLNIILLIFSFGMLIVAVFYSIAFTITEKRFDIANGLRYVIPSFVPLMWLIFYNMDFTDDDLKSRIVIATIIFALSAIGVLVYGIVITDKPLINEADVAISEYIREKDIFHDGDPPIEFSQSINKNDYYYYYLLLCKGKGIHGLDVAVPMRVNLERNLVIVDKIEDAPPSYMSLYAVDAAGKPFELWTNEVKRALLTRRD